MLRDSQFFPAWDACVVTEKGRTAIEMHLLHLEVVRGLLWVEAQPMKQAQRSSAANFNCFMGYEVFGLIGVVEPFYAFVTQKKAG